MPSNITITKAIAQSIFGPTAARFDNDAKALRELSASLGVSGDGPTNVKRTIGPVVIDGQRRRARLTATGQLIAASVDWFEKDQYRFGDALAGPLALPTEVIRYRLAAEATDDRRFVVPLSTNRKWWLASTEMTFSGHRILFSVAPQLERSVASAAAGAAIVAELGGAFAGLPEPQEIAFGVIRPTRKVTLKRALKIGHLSLASLYVRTRDYGDASSINEQEPFDASESTGEIVVTGKRRSQKPDYFVYLGRDFTQSCSSIMFDKRISEIVFLCK